MRDCSTKKIGYASSNLAITALIELHLKSIGGPINYYKCQTCEQYHLTSRGPAIPELSKNNSNSSTQNEINKWKNKFKDY